MPSIRKTISLPPSVAARLDREARRRRTSVSALVCQLLERQAEPLPYAGLVEEDEDLSQRVEEILKRSR